MNSNKERTVIGKALNDAAKGELVSVAMVAVNVSKKYDLAFLGNGENKELFYKRAKESIKKQSFDDFENGKHPKYNKEEMFFIPMILSLFDRVEELEKEIITLTNKSK